MSNPGMARLSPLDAAFLEAEDADAHANLTIASVAVMEGPPPSHEEFASGIGTVIAAIPRARQKVRRVPWDLGLPGWVDDPRFDLGYHLRRTALPAPGDDATLCALVGRIMAQRLDRERPLWESWMIEGLAGDRWAALTKVHHCMADGVSGAQLLGMIFGAAEPPRRGTGPGRPAHRRGAAASPATPVRVSMIRPAQAVWRAQRTGE